MAVSAVHERAAEANAGGAREIARGEDNGPWNGVAFADGQLNLYEDHYVRKIAHLLYVSNTESMLARNRARR